tara:strand:- start:181 stop:738 length:558 start_codon:yes stop_codon:yes gene_type:complete
MEKKELIKLLQENGYSRISSYLCPDSELLSISVWTIEDISYALKQNDIDDTEENRKIVLDNINTDILDNCEDGNNYLDDSVAGLIRDKLVVSDERKQFENYKYAMIMSYKRTSPEVLSRIESSLKETKEWIINNLDFLITKKSDTSDTDIIEEWFLSLEDAIIEDMDLDIHFHVLETENFSITLD